MAFHQCLSDSKSPQNSRTFLRTPVDLSCDVWVVFFLPPTSNFSTVFPNLFRLEKKHNYYHRRPHVPQFLLFSSKPSSNLYPRPTVRQSCYYIHFMYLCFYIPFSVIFINHIQCELITICSSDQCLRTVLNSNI